MARRSSPSLKNEVRKYWSEHLQHLRAEHCWTYSDFPPPLLQRPRVRMDFRKDVVSGLGAGVWGCLGFLPSCVPALWGDWAEQISCVKNGDSKAAREKCSDLYWWTLPKAETFSFRKQLLFRHFSSGLPLLGKVTCIFMSYFFITWLPAKSTCGRRWGYIGSGTFVQI